MAALGYSKVVKLHFGSVAVELHAPLTGTFLFYPFFLPQQDNALLPNVGFASNPLHTIEVWTESVWYTLVP